MPPSTSPPPWKPISAISSTNLPIHRSSSTLTGTPSPTTPALCASTATLASTDLERLSRRKNLNNLTAPSAPSSTSAAPPDTPNVHGHPSTSRPAASPGRSSDYAGICGPTRFQIYSDHKALENIAKVGEHNARVRHWLEFLSTYNYTLDYLKGTANGNADFLSRLPQPATDADRTGRNRLTGPDTVGIYLIRLCAFAMNEPPTPGIGLGGLVSPPSRTIPTIQPLPFTADDYGDFRLLGSRMEHHGIPNNFVGPISTRDSTARPLVSPDNAAVNTGAPPGSASRPPVGSSLSTIGATEPPPSGLISSRTRHRAAEAAGPPSTCRRLWVRRPSATNRIQKTYTHPSTTHAPGRGPAKASSDDNASSCRPHGARVTRTNPTKAGPSFDVFPAVPINTNASAHGCCCQPQRRPHLLARVERYIYRDWAREQRAEPVCYAAIRFLSLDSPSPPPADLLDSIPSAQRPLLSDVLALAAKGRLHRTDDETALLVQRPPTSQPGNSLPPPAPYPPRIYVPMLMRPWVLNTCHADTSLHLGVTRTVRMLARFYWWIGMDVSARWWIRHCLHCQAPKTSRHTIRWPTLSLPLPDGPGITVSVDYFGPLPLTPRGNVYILLFTDRFSRRADMYDVSAENFTAAGTAYILLNEYIPL